jgi:hypothetical protein
MLIKEPPAASNNHNQKSSFLIIKLLHIDPSSDDTLFLFIDMSQLGHVLALFIILASFSSSFGSYQHEDPLYPPASKRTVHDRRLEFETQSFGLTTRPIPFTSPKLVNVDDFRAKGDHGADDTEVPNPLFYFFFFFCRILFSIFFFFPLFVCSHLAKLGGRLVILKIVFLWYLEICPIILNQLHSQALANLISH